MGSSPQALQARPWTVHILIGFSLAGLILSFITGGSPTWEFALLPINLWMLYSIWMGKTWAFTLSFMLVSLCAVLLVAAVIIPVLLLDIAPPAAILWSLPITTVWITLLVHPANKQFAGLAPKSKSKS